MIYKNLVDIDFFIDNENDKLMNRNRKISVSKRETLNFIGLTGNPCFPDKKFYKKGKLILGQSDRYCLFCVRFNIKTKTKFNHRTNDVKTIRDNDISHFLPTFNVYYLNEVLTACMKSAKVPQVRLIKYETKKYESVIYFVPRKYLKLFWDLISVGIKIKKANYILPGWTNIGNLITKFSELRNRLDSVEKSIHEITTTYGMNNVNSMILSTLDLGFKTNTVDYSLRQRLMSFVEDGSCYENLSDILKTNDNALDKLIYFSEQALNGLRSLKINKKGMYIAAGPLESMNAFLVYKAYVLLKKYENIYLCKCNINQTDFLAEALYRWLILENQMEEPIGVNEKKPLKRAKKIFKEVKDWPTSFDEAGVDAIIHYFTDRRVGAQDQN